MKEKQNIGEKECKYKGMCVYCTQGKKAGRQGGREPTIHISNGAQQWLNHVQPIAQKRLNTCTRQSHNT